MIARQRLAVGVTVLSAGGEAPGPSRHGALPSATIARPIAFAAGESASTGIGLSPRGILP